MPVIFQPQHSCFKEAEILVFLTRLKLMVGRSVGGKLQ